MCFLSKLGSGCLSSANSPYRLVGNNDGIPFLLAIYHSTDSLDHQEGKEQGTMRIRDHLRMSPLPPCVKSRRSEKERRTLAPRLVRRFHLHHCTWTFRLFSSLLQRIEKTDRKKKRVYAAIRPLTYLKIYGKKCTTQSYTKTFVE